MILCADCQQHGLDGRCQVFHLPRLCCTARAIMETPETLRAKASAALLAELPVESVDWVHARCAELQAASKSWGDASC
jgi:hypothetical protein